MSTTTQARSWLRGFDSLILSSSGGKDSQVALHQAATLADDAGVLERLVVLHCDLGPAEWVGAAEVARAQADYYGVRFEIRRREQGSLLDMVRHRGLWMSAQARYCTSGMKRDVARKFYTETARELAIPGRPARLLSALGLRAAESRARARRPTVAVDRAASSGRREVTSWLPIRDFSTEEVWRTIKASGAPWHPAYRSVSRLSCRLCPLASRRDLTISARMNPELAAEYAEVEDEIGHRFRNDLSMKQIISEASELSGVPSLLAEEPRGCGAGAAPWPGTGCAA
jgi:3'-phosphoadenosine 5'-phosphosulfate sulfotransferase (PAPS reductase)/FAD synthetase